MDHCLRPDLLFFSTPRVVAALFCLPIALRAASMAASPIDLP
jgi:hypothetical protein